MRLISHEKKNVLTVPDTESLARKCVEIFLGDAEKAIKTRGRFYAAISGGNTPRHFFELLGQEPASSSAVWGKTELFWADERYVPADSPASNYKLALDTFLGRVALAEDNVHRIPTENSDFNAAARQYESTVRKVFDLQERERPQFDLIVLGMGTDGHTASLFPNVYACMDTQDIACVVYALDEKLPRITLTPPVLCAARHIVVLVSGKEKANTLKKVLGSEPDEVKYPIHALWSVAEKVTWLVDKDAAAML